MVVLAYHHRAFNYVRLQQKPTSSSHDRQIHALARQNVKKKGLYRDKRVTPVDLDKKPTFTNQSNTN